MRAADVGLNVSDIGFILSAAVDGAYVGEYNNAGDKIDLIVLLQNADGSEVGPVENVPVYTPTGHVVPFRSVVEFEPVNAPQQINHIEEMPGIRLDVSPKPGIAIETMLKKVEGVVEGLRASNAISPAVLVSYAGNADKLQQTRAAMFGNWTGFNWQSVLALVQSRGFLALLVVYLLMSSLFESFIHPIAILLTVPLAMVGGFAGLRVIHMLSLMNPVAPIQQLDVVTMLGFVILLGIVVNNAILIVHQTLNNLKAGLDPTQALHESVRTRIRPILMTAMTSVGGMAPLALMTGAGSELYRGLAAVMVGGLLVSTVFTIILVPVVYSMVLSFRIWLMKTLGRETGIPTREAVAAPAPATAARETVAASTEEVPVGAGKND
jgi:HAE1 family hydrophobic/amphiphilic exporter-1